MPSGDHSAIPTNSTFSRTSEIVAAPDLRVTIDPSKANGLLVRSQVMADKPVTVRRARIGRTIGRLAPDDVGRLDIALGIRHGTGGQTSLIQPSVVTAA